MSISTDFLIILVGDHDCSSLPPSMSLNRHERGCSGAVYTDGVPNENFCNGRHNNGTEGIYPWWSTCCIWDESLNFCRLIGTQNHKSYIISTYLKTIENITWLLTKSSPESSKVHQTITFKKPFYSF